MKTFIDLFAGIGGMRLAAESLGLKCVFSSEIDCSARLVYKDNFGEIPSGDIRLINESDIPDHNLLLAGFPCQSFSQIGKSKGFNDERGTLFFEIVRVLKHKQPNAFLLENVRNLLSHDGGKTFKLMTDKLYGLGYSIYFDVLKASDYGLPTLRPRLYIIGLKNKECVFKFPEKLPLKFNLSDVFGGNCTRNIAYTIRCGGRNSGIGDRHNWDTYLVDGRPKRLSLEQCYKIMGFPESFKFDSRKSIAYEHIGNSVAINVIKSILIKIFEMD